MEDKFVNLHLHTHYSIGDATIKIPDLFFTVNKHGQKAVAITDHGSVEGWSEFHLLGQDTNVKPIFGCEFYCKPTLEQPTDRSRYHLVVLAKNDEGAKTISKLQFISMKHKYYKPLLPYPVLFDNSDNLFISTACSLGTVGQSLDPSNRKHRPEEAEVFINQLLDVFGKENVSLEFQFHPKYPQQAVINEKLADLYYNTDAKYCIATTDAHFIDESMTRRMLQADAWHKQYDEVSPSLDSNCLGTSKIIRKNAEASGFLQMALVDDMIENTSIIADKCNVDVVNNIGQERVLPHFDKHREFKKIFLKKPRRR